MFVTAISVAEVSEINNYREYSETFASSGQPTESQLEQIDSKGFERVVYIAYSDHQNSLKNEDRLVKNLGMEYIQIPVEWTAPTSSDFHMFAGAMQREPDKKTLLHCQLNYRASAFAFLYRVIYQDVSVAQAKKDMNAIWVPDRTWTDFIFQVLAEHRVSPECDGCDWTPEDH